MAFLDHRCRCGHRREVHVVVLLSDDFGACNDWTCPCKSPEFDAVPEVVPTFPNLSWCRPDMRLTEPGTVLNAGTVHAYRLCGCGQCWAAYRDGADAGVAAVEDNVDDTSTLAF